MCGRRRVVWGMIASAGSWVVLRVLPGRNSYVVGLLRMHQTLHFSILLLKMYVRRPSPYTH